MEDVVENVVVRKEFIVLLEKICQDLKIKDSKKIIEEYCENLKNKKTNVIKM